MGIIARQAFWNTVLTTAGMALGFLNMALLFPKYLTSDEFGFTRLVVSISVIGAQVAQVGAESTVIRYFPYFKDRTNAHRGLFGLVLMITTTTAVVAMAIVASMQEAFAAWFGDASGLYQQAGMIVLPLLLAEVWFITLRGIGRAVHRSVAPTFAREFLLRVLQTLLIVLHATQGIAFEWFLILYAGTFLVTTLVVAWDLWRAGELVLGLGRIRIPRRMRRSMSRYAMFTFGSGLAVVVVGNVDQVMIGAMLADGLSYVAYYAVALFMASVVMIPARALVLPTLPIMAEAWRMRDMTRLAMLYGRTARVQLVLALYIMVGIWACIDQVFEFLAPEYAPGKEVLLVLGAANVINLSTGLSGGLVSTSRAYWFDAVSGLAYLVLNIVLDYVFILRWGMMGAAWSSLVALLIVLAWRLLFLRRRFGLWPYDKRTAMILLVGAITAGCVGVLPTFGPVWVDLLLRGCVVTVVFWSLVGVFNLDQDIIGAIPYWKRTQDGASGTVK
ncbi:MAG: oligosaccharide flippase family protein [Flavobacteriales bacterium]